MEEDSDGVEGGSSTSSDLATGAAARSRSHGGGAFSADAASTHVAVFGAGAFGQLGSGEEREVLLPTVLSGLSLLRVCAAACGDYHTAVVTAVCAAMHSNAVSLPHAHARTLHTHARTTRQRRDAHLLTYLLTHSLTWHAGWRDVHLRHRGVRGSRPRQ